MTSGSLEKKDQKELVRDILDSELKYNTITTKGSVEFRIGESGKKTTGVFKIIKDSVLQTSIQVFGFEVARMTFTPDSILVVDRMKKRYVREAFNSSSLVDGLEFNFYNLQALLTNKLFIPGGKSIDKSDYNKFSVTATPDLYMLQTTDKAGLTYNFAVDGSDRIMSTLIHSKKNDFTIQWSYANFVIDKSYTYPTDMQGKINIGKVRLDLGINYSKFDINENVSVDMAVSSKYTKVSFEDFLSSLAK